MFLLLFVAALAQDCPRTANCTNGCVIGSVSGIGACCPVNCRAPGCTVGYFCLNYPNTTGVTAITNVTASQCKDGFYGKGCESNCNGCAMPLCTLNGACAAYDRTTRQWDDATHCKDGRYGSDCSRTCNVQGCAKPQCTQDGYCSGYHAYLEQSTGGIFYPASHCLDGLYGDLCTSVCRNCAAGKCTVYGDCFGYNGQPFDGVDEWCVPGWGGMRCNIPCTGCATQRCSPGQCEGYNRTSGSTAPCLPGRYGALCDRLCSDRLLNSCKLPGCSNAGNCVGATWFEEEQPADHCQVGFTGTSCNVPCSSNCRWGCLNSLSGDCVGYRNNACAHCKSGFHGSKCTISHTPAQDDMYCPGRAARDRAKLSSTKIENLVPELAESSCRACHEMINRAKVDILKESEDFFKKGAVEMASEAIGHKLKGEVGALTAVAYFGVNDQLSAKTPCQSIAGVFKTACDGAALLFISNPASFAAGVLSFIGCSVFGIGAEGICETLMPGQLAMIDLCPCKLRRQRNVEDALEPSSVSVGQAFIWPSNFVAYATLETGGGRLDHVLLAQSVDIGATALVTVDINQTRMDIQLHTCAPSQEVTAVSRHLVSGHSSACVRNTDAPPLCATNAPAFMFIRVLENVLLGLATARNMARETAARLLTVHDFWEEQSPYGERVVLNGISVPNARFWRASVEFPDANMSRWDVRFIQTRSLMRPIAITIERNSLPYASMVFLAFLNTSADALRDELVEPCNTSSPLSATRLANMLGDQSTTTFVPLATTLPKVWSFDPSIVSISSAVARTQTSGTVDTLSTTRGPASSSTRSANEPIPVVAVNGAHLITVALAYLLAATAALTL